MPAILYANNKNHHSSVSDEQPSDLLHGLQNLVLGPKLSMKMMMMILKLEQHRILIMVMQAMIVKNVEEEMNLLLEIE